MKTIKKSIFAALIVAIMGIFITKVLSNTTANDLFDQNVEALALEDPNHPSSGWVIGASLEYITLYWVDQGIYYINLPCCIMNCETNACNTDDHSPACGKNPIASL